jgi:hypothetical protein
MQREEHSTFVAKPTKTKGIPDVLAGMDIDSVRLLRHAQAAWVCEERHWPSDAIGETRAHPQLSQDS